MQSRLLIIVNYEITLSDIASSDVTDANCPETAILCGFLRTIVEIFYHQNLWFVVVYFLSRVTLQTANAHSAIDRKNSQEIAETDQKRALHCQGIYTPGVLG